MLKSLIFCFCTYISVIGGKRVTLKFIVCFYNKECPNYVALLNSITYQKYMNSEINRSSLSIYKKFRDGIVYTTVVLTSVGLRESSSKEEVIAKASF